jgi:DNA excision repair protein ERCC-6
VFSAILTLRKLCNHPLLAYQQGKIIWHDDDDTTPKEKGTEKNSRDMPVSSLCSGDIRWADSGKLIVLSRILPVWKQEGHKVLIFCQMHSMMSLIEIMLNQMQLSHMVLDGRTPVYRRSGIIKRYNEDDSIFALLLTTRTGGVGISLTAANRVILVDPDWNPQTDIQARERSWRIGQKREVTIYRLICKGTIEEKMYHRQIFKLLLASRILDNPRQKRFFSKNDITELFELGGSDEHPVESNVDLPEEGEVDLTVSESRADYSIEPANIGDSGDTTTTMTPHSQGRVGQQRRHNEPTNSAPNNPNNNSKDRQLLHALFNGEEIASVYDHGFFEGTNNSGKKAVDDYTKALAQKAVDKALAQLQSSSSRSATGDDITVNGSQFKRPSMSSRGVHSTTLLTGLRNMQSSSSSSNTSLLRDNTTGGGSGGGGRTQRLDELLVSAPEPSDDDNILPILSRLREMFQHADSQQGLSTGEILKSFPELPDHFAPVFREMLRRTAILKGGKWFAI